MGIFRDIVGQAFRACPELDSGQALFPGCRAKALPYSGLIKSLILIGLFILLGKTYAYASGDMTITKYHSDISVFESSQIEVKETIEVQFHRQRHGIYRDIPYIYKDDLGGKVKTPLEVIGITNEKISPGNIRQ